MNPILDKSKVILSNADLKRKIILPDILDEKLAEFCGIHIADGYMAHKEKQRHYVIKWGGNPKTEKEYYDVFIKDLWGDVFNAKVKPGLKHNGTYGIEFYSKGIMSFLETCIGISKGKKVDIVSIPKIIKRTSRSNISKQMIACLRGIIDNDFYLEIDRNKIALGGWFASKNLVLDLHNYLNKLGIKFRIRLDYKYYDKRVKKTVVSHKIESCGKENVIKWFDLIGTHNLRFIKKYNNLIT